MICDGDSKSYGAVRNYYGVCDLCYKNKELHKSPKNMNNGKKQKSTKNGTTVISQGQQIVIVL